MQNALWTMDPAGDERDKRGYLYPIRGEEIAMGVEVNGLRRLMSLMNDTN